MGELTQEKRKVTKILKPPETAEKKAERLRVCAYCRVSTKQDEQRTSYDTQVRAYTEMISANPEWELVGIYADWGISGTQSKKRPEFMRMLAECEAGNIDMVICKSISRFSRNTLDAVNYIRRLKEMGIRILFEKEGVDTDAVISEMLLSVLSAFAQEESHSHSENVKWGKRKRTMNGQPGLYPPYGYRKQGEDQMVIEPKEAEVVRWIFESYEHGMPIAEITATLLSNGTPAPRIDENRVGRWEDSRIWQMFMNVKYAGHILTQRRYTTDFLTGKQVKNTGQLPQNFIANHHEAIIPQKQFDRVLRILSMKSTSREIKEQYPYAGLLKCPYCGKTLWCRKPRSQKTQFLLCEGENACGGFAMDRTLTDQSLVDAYNSLDMDVVRRIAVREDTLGDEAKKLLVAKEKYPVVSSVEFWWLDDHVERIEYGKHTSENNETISIFWKCGISQTAPSGVLKPTQNPRHKAALWNGAGKKGNKNMLNSLRGQDVPFGYRTSGEKGTFVIEPDEAAVVQRIFDQYERGISVNTILKGLMDDQVKPPGFEASGSMAWEKSRIHYFIQNEKYAGDYKLRQWSRKWYRQEPGQEAKEAELIKGHHEPIISRKQFDRCNQIYRMRLRDPYQSYPFGNMLHCPFCGHVLTAHKLGCFRNERYFCCEGDGACREFVICVDAVKEAVLRAYADLPTSKVEEILKGFEPGIPEQAGRLLEVKVEHETFTKVDYWWLDELIERFEFGEWEEAESGLQLPLHIRWRCGIETSAHIELKSEEQRPQIMAGKWDAYLIRNPDLYPGLTEEVKKARGDDDG